MSEHLKLVLVLTELETIGKAITIISLSERVSGEHTEVSRLVDTLVELGKAQRYGAFVRATNIPARCPVTDGYGTGGVQCELAAGHAGPHECPEALARFEASRTLRAACPKAFARYEAGRKKEP